MEIDDDTDEIPVLIAGGGLIGLPVAMLLANHDVASLAVERNVGGSPLPRAANAGDGSGRCDHAGIDCRTNERVSQTRPAIKLFFLNHCSP